jgi:integrase
MLHDYDSLMSIPDEDKFNLVRDYLDHRRNNEKVSYATINMSLAPIKLFYKVNRVTLHWKHLSKHKGDSAKIIDDRLYTDEEISKLLVYVDLRMRIVVLTLLNTGMRVGALGKRNETYDDVIRKLLDFYHSKNKQQQHQK